MIEWVDVDFPVLQTERAKEGVKKPQWIKKDTMKKEQIDLRKSQIKFLEKIIVIEIKNPVDKLNN